MIACRHDPRTYQISALLLLLGYGVTALDFDVSASRAATILACALCTQWVATRLCGLPAFDPKSALISGLSLCLVLRTNSDWLAAAAGVAAIASKFTLRLRGRHLCNPTTFAIVLLLGCAGGRVWVSPGQWGSTAFFGFLLICGGSVVVNRAARSDVALAFLGFHLAILFGRSAWLGEPAAIPLHRAQNGALLLFAFFMISDPRTTPDSRAGRIAFALVVAVGAAYIQFHLFRANSLLWSLAASALCRPLLDFLLPALHQTCQPTRVQDAPSHVPEPVLS